MISESRSFSLPNLWITPESELWQTSSLQKLSKSLIVKKPGHRK